MVKAWLGLTPRPTAIYCFNNTLARFLIDALRRVAYAFPRI